MLEESLRDVELRAAQQLTEEQRRNKELIVRVEREKQLEIENCTIKYNANNFFFLMEMFSKFDSFFQVASGRERSGADEGRVRQTPRANGATPRRTIGSSAAALRGGDESPRRPRRAETNGRSGEARTGAMGHGERVRQTFSRWAVSRNRDA